MNKGIRHKAQGTSRLTAFAEKREERRVVARLCVALKYVAGDITF